MEEHFTCILLLTLDYRLCSIRVRLLPEHLTHQKTEPTEITLPFSSALLLAGLLEESSSISREEHSVAWRGNCTHHVMRQQTAVTTLHEGRFLNIQPASCRQLVYVQRSNAQLSLLVKIGWRLS